MTAKIAKAKLAPLMSSKSQVWCTPQIVVDAVKRVAPIGLDPCSNPSSIVGARTEFQRARGENGLRRSWAVNPGELVYVNPPFKGVDAWMSACAAVGRARVAPVIALVPARTDTAWWADWIAPPGSDAIVFWRGRLTFLGAPHPAPFPCAFACWGEAQIVERFVEVFGEFGDVWRALGDRDVNPAKIPPARHDWPPRGVDGEPIA